MHMQFSIRTVMSYSQVKFDINCIECNTTEFTPESMHLASISAERIRIFQSEKLKEQKRG